LQKFGKKEASVVCHQPVAIKPAANFEKASHCVSLTCARHRKAAWVRSREYFRGCIRKRSRGIVASAVLNYTPCRVDGRRQHVTILHWVSHTHRAPLTSILNTNHKWCRFRTRNADSYREERYNARANTMNCRGCYR